MCFYWDVKIWYHLGQKTCFFSLSEAIKFSWWSLRALSLREYTFKSKSFQSSQIMFERNVPPSVVSHAMQLSMWQTCAEIGNVGKGYCACLRACVLCIGCDMLFVDFVASYQRQDGIRKANLNWGEGCQTETDFQKSINKKRNIHGLLNLLRFLTHTGTKYGCCYLTLEDCKF